MEILYGAPAYHMSVVLNNPKHFQFWTDLAFDVMAPEKADWQQLFRGFAATTDLPSAHYFEHIAAAFPEAKVVLTVRDEQEWFESYRRLMKAIHSFRLIRFLPPLNRLWPYGQRMNQVIFGDDAINENGLNRSAFVTAYRNHNNRVRQSIPADKLLEFDVREGWEPLCQFLDKDVPSVPFPHRNAGSEGPTKILASAVRRLSMRVIVLSSTAVFLAVVLLVWLR
jgi:hypothetical protein